MNWIQKLDSFWKGLAIGLLFPALCFFCYWLFRYSYMGFPERFIKYLLTGQMLSSAIKICALGNLLIFYFFLNRGINKATKGIILSVLLYVALVFYVMYFYEGGF